MIAQMLAVIGSTVIFAAAPASGGVPPALEPLPMVPGQPVELGAVRWGRDFEEAARRATESRRPLLVLFDEVPGCHNCTSFGENVLTNALVVEAAETLFVPVAVYNNKGGEDARVLKRFNEPAWNNPVVRVIDPRSEKDLAPRVSETYAPAPVAAAMRAALRAGGSEPPVWLGLLADSAPEKTETATFAMFCFWEGEAKLGSLDGVLSTSAGFLDGRECVTVEFDPERLPFRTLVQRARTLDCLHRVYTTTAEQQLTASGLVGADARRAVGPARVSESDTSYRLRHSDYAAVPMTPTQATRVNAALAAGENPDRFLSPRQLEKKRVR